MKWFNKLIICLFALLPTFVSAGSISFDNPKRLASDRYSFTLTVKDIDLNYLSGKINVTNGTIDKVTMSNGWSNKNGTKNSFYFYHDGISTGKYLVATFEVVMTGDSEYSISDFKYGSYTCEKDSYNNYFGPNGELVNETTFNNECGKSKDATLKSLKPSIGVLSPSFSSNNYYYTLKADNDVSLVTFTAIPTNEKAKVLSGTNCTLKNAVTNCLIEVVSEYGTTKTYTISVYKENYQNETLTINNFKVHNGSLNKTFNETTHSYDLTPDKNAEYIYFTFLLDGISYTSDKCSANSSTCTLTITSNGTKKKYIFTLPSTTEEMKTENSTTTTTKKSTVSKTQTEDKKETNNKTENVVSDETKANEEETLDPIEYNKENKKEEQKTGDVESEVNEETSTIKKENKGKEKNKFLIVICLVNVLLGACIGFFIKKKVEKL